jgi:ABC-type transport system substrate-binding protein
MRWLMNGAVALLGVMAAPYAAEAQTLRMMKSLDAPHYDAQRTTWSPTSDIVNMIQDTLVALDWDGKTAIPYLAKSWEISPDGKTYTFKLRDDVQFCSGKKFTADDVVYSFKRLKDPEVRAPYAWRAGDIKEVRALDPYTVAYQLTEPYRAVAAAHHVHQRHSQQGECGGVGQGLRYQGCRWHGAVVLRILAAANGNRPQTARRLSLGSVDVPE